MADFIGYAGLEPESPFIGADLPPPATLFEAPPPEAPPSRAFVKASAPAPPPDEFKKRCDEFHAKYTTPPSLEERTRIATLPQHLPSGEANPEWLASRIHKITGSAVGALVDVNPYESSEETVARLVWPSYNPFTGNDATRWGNRHEDDAQAAFALALGVEETRIDNPGLVICGDEGRGHFAMSPDGILNTPSGQELVEYKCPFRRQFTDSEEALRDALADGGGLYRRALVSEAKCGTVPCPSYYHAQVQWGMGLLHLPRAHFVVWCPYATATPQTVPTPHANSRVVTTPRGTIQHTIIEFDAEYFASMVAKVDALWRKSYVPGCVWRDARCLDEPDLVPALDLDV